MRGADTDREGGPSGGDEAGNIVPGSCGAEDDNVRGPEEDTRACQRWCSTRAWLPKHPLPSGNVKSQT
eukprot:922800-Karenia_brevis.AAC.1